MDCNEVRPLIDASADRELSPVDERRVQQHIAGCAACQRETEIVRVLAGTIRQAGYHRAPDALRARIVAGLPAAALSSPPEGARRRAWRFPRFDGWRLPVGVGGGAANSGTAGSGWLTVLVIALCAAVAGVTLTLRRPADASPFVDELVSSHVRAQLSGRDIDIISTDQHTVKPWFNGRLDYAPPVVDLTASGFPLAGGRLDYLDHRRVAVLTYRYRKHVIDVYVFPDTANRAGGDAGAWPGSSGATLVRDGYSLVRWREDGMVWWAITDAAPDALSALETALKARPQPSE
ncbi:anti-sigma factor family protein [Paraburkholderia sartisoli]|uniref:Transmembrane transcriptional regulator (Anti-sigma factor RsiW) n=1 Tax=Paraburkholderia sartisoli TaxID=83784 RepID=A0A1H4E8E0_9BURK|nr:anti-sigma factor [Paraburkholderia sartisoli]SEA81295.1 Transmembrane transcriptional regulator (anti-sigma factor RsiW) [Paraburkholderia sartisoli]